MSARPTPAWTGAAGRSAARSSAWTGILALTVLAFAPIVYLAANGVLSADEIHALHVARQPGLAAVWRALERGADNQPPLDYWLRHLSIVALGPTPLGLRLAPILAVWGTMIVLFNLVRRRLGLWHAWSAALLMLLVVGLQAALMEHGYAIQLLCFALALDAWDRLATDGESAAQATILLASLVAAVYAHYYSILYFLAFFAAACVQAWRRPRLSWRPFAVLGAAGLLCLPLAPLVQAARPYRAGFWAPPTGAFFDSFYPVLLWFALPCLVLMGLLLALSSVMRPSVRQDARAPRRLPADTTVALAAFVMLPAPMLIMAVLATGAFHPRYLVAGGVAACLLVIALVEALNVDTRHKLAILVVIPALSFALQAGRRVRGVDTRPFPAAFTEGLARLQDRFPGPVVISDREQFFELSYYDPDRRFANCYFIYDAFPDKRTYVDRAVMGLSQVMPLRIMTYEQAKARHETLVVIVAYREDDVIPVIDRAIAEGADASLHHDGDSDLSYWLVTFPR